jgi:hypothetical protein
MHKREVFLISRAFDECYQTARLSTEAFRTERIWVDLVSSPGVRIREDDLQGYLAKGASQHI